MANEQNVPYEWNESDNDWESMDDSWESSKYIKYVPETKNTLYISGEYTVLANSIPYKNVLEITGISESIIDSGVGTICKKEFCYSIDSLTFSEYQELTTPNLSALGSFNCVWFKIRYVLLSGGPITISRADVIYTKKPVDSFSNYSAPSIQDESKVYAFPVSYKSNFLWEPYKMNRGVRLYKDLNLMVNNLFGHDAKYYRAMPQGRSKDVFLLENSLFNHDDGKCVKVIIPNNVLPDSKLNMGPFGVDYDMPFEIQMDKDYFQKIFGSSAGPQKRDVLYFPLTDRIYEVSSSYMFRDFMYEPLYFKITLMKWSPKSNAKQSETLDSLEEYTNSVAGLFGELIEQEEIKITNPEQFNVAYKNNDPVRLHVYADQTFGNVQVLNYYTVIANSYYKMDATVQLKKIRADVDTQYLVNDAVYYARFSPSSTQTDVQWYYSMKKLTYLGNDDDGVAVFAYDPGVSQVESLFSIPSIFNSGSSFYLYEDEYDGTLGSDPVASCDISSATFYKTKIVKYKNTNTFTENDDRSFSAWFKLKTNTTQKVNILSFTIDVYTRLISLTLSQPYGCMISDLIELSRTTTSEFLIFGEVSEITSPTEIKIKVDQEILSYVQNNFSSWSGYTDLQAQKSFSKVFLNSIYKSKGLKIEIYGVRHVKITMNESYSYFSLPGTSLSLENDKWYGLFINFSNTFKQLTVNIWKMQWDSATNLPATTDLKLVYNKMIALAREDRSSDSYYFIEPSFMDLTNLRLFSRTVETDKQVLMLNQNIVKDAQWGIIIDNALPQSNMPHIGYIR